jgi:serine palmitoyltransferase
VTGARTSSAPVIVFKHNDLQDLERVIRKAIIDGQPLTHRPWTKILIIVEGIYSMEGEMCPLKEIVAVKKKYGCYLYVDEAHSIGAIGRTGRGICEYHHVDPRDVDILMGTFTKSFGAVGGYIAADRSVITALRNSCAGGAYSASISPPAAQQVISAFKILTGEDGTKIGQEKLDSLKRNSNYFRQKIVELGCRVIGDWDSPIVPMLIFEPSKLSCFSRLTLENNIAVVVVGYPATPLTFSRVRFCISAAHTIKDLDFAIEKLKICTRDAGVQYDKSIFSLK